MKQIGFDNKFVLLCQEAYLTKNTILSGFDFLLKANFYQEKDGYFYSAFFNLSIGFERLLKLAVVTDYMLSNEYKTPTIKHLKKCFGHDVNELYLSVLNIKGKYSKSHQKTLLGSDDALLKFLSEYAKDTRYFNLNEVCEEKFDRSPLYKWLDIARAIYEENTKPYIRQKTAMDLMYKMDSMGYQNGFTRQLDEGGHPMMVYDILHRQYVIEKSAPLVVWRLIELFRPVHYILMGMSEKASEYETSKNYKTMVVPHYEDFFYFFLANKDAIKRRKNWLGIFK
ncbi:hypothetical protein KDK82_1026 [Delftia sp. K82]|uniref:hypothetical protein n=1 Tax=Delftia sp. K82 TaxID=1472718 RepID=UPI000B4940B3|nr:hypothetical protein [Delftia sp. K82]OWG17555.1 hypothetical protein KDK82_1026 [Delftia sp. K82]